MKRRLVFLLQLGVSVALLAWIFRDPGFRADMIHTFAKADPLWGLAALAVSGVGILLGFLRWGIFLRVVGIRESPWTIFRIAAVGLFFNSFLPGAVGGDAVKAGWLAARGAKARDALLSAVMDRMSGLGALVLCSLLFISLRFSWLMQSPVVAVMIHMVFLYLAVVSGLVGLSFVLASRGAVDRLPARFPGRHAIQECAAAYRLFLDRWPQTLLAALISVAILLAYFLTFYFSACSLGVRMPLLDFLALMPAVDILAALPISLGGFGIREGALVAILGGLAQIPEATAVSISVAGAAASLLWGCLGLLLLPAFRREARQ